MAWRTVELGTTTWNVTCAAERRGPDAPWRLVLAFRRPAPRRTTVWAEFPLQSASRSELFVQAERIPPRALAAVLSDLLAA